ncbi:MAG: T9SS type A sorting domain-containing protein [Candidatus Kapaibacterium sp.]
MRASSFCRTVCQVFLLMIWMVVGGEVGRAERDKSMDEIRTMTCTALKTTGNAGTEFYLTFLPCYEEAGNNKLMLYIASYSQGNVTVEVGGRGFTTVKKLIPNDIVPVELGPSIGQAFSKGINGVIPPEQVYTNAAIHITATVPVVVYAVTRFNYTSDSFLAIPVHTLGKEYVVASMADMSWMYGGLSLPSETAIVAAYDSTRVSFVLGGPVVTVSGGGLRSGDSTVFMMNKGDVWVIGNNGTSKEGDMSGSVVRASKPVGLISGNQCANVPTVIRWCDFITEMEMPTEMWGRYLQVPKYASRRNGYFMKVFAKEPGTRVSYNGSYWKNITTVGGQEGRGWIYQRVDGSGNNVVSLSADKPISATVFNPGQEDDNISTDPFQMNVLPMEQYQKDVIFCTPGSRGGIGFTRNYIGVVFEIDSATQGIPQDLEFGTSVNGKLSWRAFTAVFGPSFSTKDIFQQRVNGKAYAFKECALPADNVYGIRCSKAFMCYSYGGSDYDSYGHPTTGGLVVAKTDTASPTVAYTAHCDGSLGVHASATVSDMPDDDMLRANLGTIQVQPDATSNYSLSYDAFIPGDSRSTRWRLTVVDPDVDAQASVIFTDRAGKRSCVENVYRATKLSASQASIDWGVVARNSSATRDVFVKNEGTGPVTVTRLEFKNNGKGAFSFEPGGTPALPFVLAPGEGRSVTVRYTATNTGETTDSLGFGTECGFRFRTMVKGATEGATNVRDEGATIVRTDILGLSPNPARDQTVMTYMVEQRGDIVVSVVDVTGRTVARFAQGMQDAGTHSVTLSTSGMVAGAYSVALHTSQKTVVLPLVVSK